MKEIIGTIKGIDLLLKDSIGHQSHRSGMGKWRNRKQDKKLRRIKDKESTKY